MKNLFSLAIYFSATWRDCLSFTPLSRSISSGQRASWMTANKHSPNSFLSAKDEEWNAGFDEEYPGTSRMVKDLVTERGLDAMLYYALEFRDSTTEKWLVDFVKDNPIHELGSEEFILSLISSPEEDILIHKHAQRRLGGSGNNPYLNDRPSTFSYNVTIDPVRIGFRLMEVRDQVVREWSQDLNNIVLENAEVFRHHYDNLEVGKEKAESLRQRIFDHDPFSSGGDSPYRARNYREMMAYLTRLSVASVEAQFRSVGNIEGIKFLESYKARVRKVVEKERAEKALPNFDDGAAPLEVGGGFSEVDPTTGETVGLRPSMASEEEKKAKKEKGVTSVIDEDEFAGLEGNAILEMMLNIPTDKKTRKLGGQAKGSEGFELVEMILDERENIAKCWKECLKTVDEENNVITQRHMEGDVKVQLQFNFDTFDQKEAPEDIDLEEIKKEMKNDDNMDGPIFNGAGFGL